VGSACSDVADAPGRGMNLAGVFDGRNAARGWRVRAEHLDDIAAAGFTTVRLPVCWWGYAQSSYPYRLDGRILDAVEAVLGEAWARDLAVVLTMHHADAVYGDPQGSVDQLVAIWRQIAERFAAATGALAFELLNEPHPPMTPGQWNALLPTVLGGVRDVDANRLVVIGGAEASTVGVCAISNSRRMTISSQRCTTTSRFTSRIKVRHGRSARRPGWAPGGVRPLTAPR